MTLHYNFWQSTTVLKFLLDLGSGLYFQFLTAKLTKTQFQIKRVATNNYQLIPTLFWIASLHSALLSQSSSVRQEIPLIYGCIFIYLHLSGQLTGHFHLPTLVRSTYRDISVCLHTSSQLTFDFTLVNACSSDFRVNPRLADDTTSATIFTSE